MVAGAQGERVDVAGALRDAAFTGLVAFGLFLPLIGFQTVTNIRDELTLTTRWPLLAAFVAITAAGRFGYSVALAPWLAARARKPAKPAVSRWRFYFGKWFVPFAIGFVIVYPVLVLLSVGFGGALKWIDNFGIQILIYVMLGWGLNIVVGLAGLLDLGYVAFYAVGAYSYALLAKNFGLSFWILLPLAGILSSFWGILLGFPVLRLRGDYLAIVTLAFGEIIRLILINWTALTNGYAGITGIPRPTFFGIPFTADDNGFAAVFGLEFSPLYRVIFLYYVILALALLTSFVTVRLRRLPVGRAWEALREDQIACRSLGINTTNTKLTAFAMGAMFAGFAGSFFAAREAFISPESFTFIEFGDRTLDRGTGRHGQPDRRRHCRHRDDRRHGDFARTRFSQRNFRGDLRSHSVPYAAVRPGHGADHDLAAARTDFDARALGIPERAQEHLGRSGQRGPRLMAHDDSTVLRVEHLTMRFGGLVAVDDLSFEMKRGTITALIGPNGAGKTTVFNCITGFYRPTEGRLALQHGDPALWNALEVLTDSGRRGVVRPNGALFLLERMPDYLVARQARVARTFQNIRLFAGMTVLENLLVAQHNRLMVASGYTLLGVLGFPSYAAAERAALDKARAWLDRFGLLDRADDPAGELPYGAQRRLEVARAMCTDPVLLCLDEPAAGLNPRESAELNELLLVIREEYNLSILLIEHDMSVVMKISDRVVVLDYGVKIADGASEAVRNDPKVIAAYLGVADEEVEQVQAAVGL